MRKKINVNFIFTHTVFSNTYPTFENANLSRKRTPGVPRYVRVNERASLPLRSVPFIQSPTKY